MNNIKTKNKILMLMAIILFAFMAILIVNIYIAEKEDLNKESENFAKDSSLAYSNVLKFYEVEYKNILEEVLNLDGVLDAIESHNREKLYSLVYKKWQELQKKNPDIVVLHFHKANGYSFLRMHNPQKYDDNIASKREMCKYIQKEQKFVSSFEAGIHLLGYRIMTPIFKDKKYLGALEIGVKPNFILRAMKDINGVHGLIFSKNADIYKKNLNDTNKLTIGDYSLESSTLDDKALINYMPKDYNFENDFTIEKDGKTYAVYLFNHVDFVGNISAKTLLFSDITYYREHFKESIYKAVFFTILLYIIFLFMIKSIFEKMLNQIDETTAELEKNVAFLKSHQLAMDESSIVSKADLYGNITYANDNFCKITGYTKEEVIGKPHNIIRHESNSKEIFKDLWNTIRAKKTWKGILKNKGKNKDYWVDIVILPILDEKGDIVEYIAMRHDITTMIQQQQKLDKAANTDALTGYGNRYKLNNDIKNSTNPALAILNIDSFSQINDFYGDEKGDVVIIKLGSIIFEILKKENCQLYHLQGDEFVVFNENIDKNTFIENITELSKSISKVPIVLDNEEIFLTLSTSISFEEQSKILVTADIALKIAKRENKNLVVYNDDYASLNDEYKNNIKWAKKIKDALQNDKIVPVFQPIVNNVTKKWEKYEALVRLEDDGKLIAPYFFLEISKQTKHYTEITKVMLHKSFEMFKDKDLEFSVNLTIEDILNDEIKEYIFEMLQDYKIGSRVVFEIVESESIENFEQIAIFIKEIKSYGCKIAIDDFGTGYSNFEYLMKVNADYIKIDGSMIKDIDKNSDAQMVVSTIVDFAKKMGMKTIAEFVENESVLKVVEELGIDYTQGYHYSMPKQTIDISK